MAKTVAVIGLGEIGRQMAQVPTSLGANVLGVDPKQCVEGVAMTILTEAIAHAELLTLHCSLNPSNHGLFNRSLLLSLIHIYEPTSRYAIA